MLSFYLHYFHLDSLLLMILVLKHIDDKVLTGVAIDLKPRSQDYFRSRYLRLAIIRLVGFHAE